MQVRMLSIVLMSCLPCVPNCLCGRALSSAHGASWKRACIARSTRRPPGAVHPWTTDWIGPFQFAKAANDGMRSPSWLSNEGTAVSNCIRQRRGEDKEMRQIKIYVTIAIATTFLIVAAPAQAQVDVSGRWQLTLPPPPAQNERQPQAGNQQPPQRGQQPDSRRNGPPTINVVLQQNGESLMASASAERGAVHIENGAIKGKTIALTLRMTGPDGREHVLRLQGQVDGNTMTGTLAGEQAVRDGNRESPVWQARRIAG